MILPPDASPVLMAFLHLHTTGHTGANAAFCGAGGGTDATRLRGGPQGAPKCETQAAPILSCSGERTLPNDGGLQAFSSCGICPVRLNEWQPSYAVLCPRRSFHRDPTLPMR